MSAAAEQQGLQLAGLPPESAQAVIARGAVATEKEILADQERYRTDAEVQSNVEHLKKLHPGKRLRLVPLTELSQAVNIAPTQSQAAPRAVMAHGSDGPLRREALKVFEIAGKARSSDLAIDVTAKDVSYVWHRINGDMRLHAEIPTKDAMNLTKAFFDMRASGSGTHFVDSEPQDGAILENDKEGIYLPEGVFGIRYAHMSLYTGLGVTLRFLYEASGTSEVDGPLNKRMGSLGFTPRHIDSIGALQIKPDGLIIVAGPTGSGKSTTLKHILEAYLGSHPNKKIMTAEDPVEYLIRVNEKLKAWQSAVSNASSEEERAKKFGDISRALVRMDLDVGMLSEMRDGASAMSAIKLAESGHPIYSTLHASNAFGIVPRLLDILFTAGMGDQARMVLDSSTLAGLIHQRLIKTVCKNCALSFEDGKKQGRLPPTLVKALEDHVSAEILKGVRVKNPAGCSHCKVKNNEPGSAPRTMIAEVVELDVDIIEVMRRDGLLAGQKYWRRERQGRPAAVHALTKVYAGLLDPHEAEEVTGAMTRLDKDLYTMAEQDFQEMKRGVVA